ncbi:MAG: restriction endonuclease [Eubacteriales bacterium]
MSRRKKNDDLNIFYLILFAIVIYLFIEYWEIIISIVIIYVVVKILIAILKHIAIIQANTSWDEIDNMDGVDFEHFVAGMLEKNGFYNIKLTPSSGDFGADIIAYKNFEKYVFQCKRYSADRTVGLKPVQEAYSGKIHYGASKAVVVTNIYFSKNAAILAKETNVILWDRTDLERLIAGLKK